ncbi:MAG: nuclear transport factor 2 family protein [Arenicellales bacterium]|nr:nuclear transport factor 2 family protein [Arenicellales bacterium]
MKPAINGLLIMTLFSAKSLVAYAETPDVAAIKTIIESVAVLADSGNFEALEKLYADEIQVDYTSLAGGEPELKSPQALMTEWAGVLPGFERTRHDISNIKVSVTGSQAVATADVIADHHVAGLYWQVTGDYRYELVDAGDRWRITATTFNLRDEKGTREVFGPAIENATTNPSSYVIRRQTAEAVRTFLTSLEEKDMEKFASVWADDVVQDMPFSPEGHPKRVVGKENLVNLYSGWPQNTGKANFTSHLIFYPMQDPETVFVEFKGDVEVIPTGRQYKQMYGGLFHVVDGKIKLFREYYDPAPFTWAFGLDEQ